MRPHILLVLALALSACRLTDQEGMVLTTDKSYRAVIIGTRANGLAAPDGLLWKDGRLYLADEGGSAVRSWPGTGEAATLANGSSGIASPEDLVVDGRGTVFFTDDSAGGLWKIENGRTSRVAGREQGLGPTEGIALTPSGAILVGDAAGHQILSVARDGKVSALLGPEHGIRKPESLAFDEQGNLFIADNEDDVLYLLTRDGRLHRPIRGSKGFSPESLWYARGTLYITDSKHGKLFRYSAEDGLETIAAFAGKLAKLAGVTTDDEGRIYVSVQSDLRGGRGYIIRLEKAASS
jgi:sugar lactone lactonase YvrE